VEFALILTMNIAQEHAFFYILKNVIKIKDFSLTYQAVLPIRARIPKVAFLY